MMFMSPIPPTRSADRRDRSAIAAATPPVICWNWRRRRRWLKVAKSFSWSGLRPRRPSVSPVSSSMRAWKSSGRLGPWRCGSCPAAVLYLRKLVVEGGDRDRHEVVGAAAKNEPFFSKTPTTR